MGRASRQAGISPLHPPAPDLLHGYVARPVTLSDPGREGLHATLVHDEASAVHPDAVLYIHGYNDYFFNAEMGRRFAEAGYAFFALDLRRYGRSWRPGQLLAYSTDFGEYFEELDVAVDLIRRRSDHRRLVLMGHSTGGLIAALYAGHRPGLDALVLNSPFFAFRMPRRERVIMKALAETLGPVAPRIPLPTDPDPRYAWSLHRDFGRGGVWTYDRRWKRPGSLPVRVGWVRAVLRAQRQIRRLRIRCPVLVLASDTRGGQGEGFDATWFASDSVLDPQDCVRVGRRLGPHVQLEQIPAGMHDLFLSAASPREDAYARTFAWLENRHR